MGGLRRSELRDAQNSGVTEVGRIYTVSHTYSRV